MCDDHHHHGPSGPTTLDWGRSAVLFGTMSIVLGALLVAPLPQVGERVLSMVLGPVLAFGGWSISEFVRARSDGIAIRLAGIALVVAGATLGIGSMVESPAFSEIGTLAASGWLFVSTLALAAGVTDHPLFGTSFGWIGTGLGVASIAWLGAEPAMAGLSSIYPWIALAIWYSAILYRTARAVRKMSLGYPGWTEPALA